LVLEKVVVDASALVSLASADFLWYPAANFELVVPQSVMKEIGALREKPETKALVDKIAKVKSKLTVVKPEKSASGPDRGEKDCFSVCLEQGIKLFVLDDFRAIRKMKPAAISRGIKLLLSVFFIAHAAAKRKISKDEALTFFDRMAEQRDWLGSRVYMVGKEFLERELRKSR